MPLQESDPTPEFKLAHLRLVHTGPHQPRLEGKPLGFKVAPEALQLVLKMQPVDGSHSPFCWQKYLAHRSAIICSISRRRRVARGDNREPKQKKHDGRAQEA